MTAGVEHPAGGGGGPSFASMGEIRLRPTSEHVRTPGVGSLQHQQQQHGGGGGGEESYFPLPGAAPIRPSHAITPGAVMISNMNGNGSMISSMMQIPEDPDEAANSPGLVQALGDPSGTGSRGYLSEGGESLVAFADALKGNAIEPSAVRSALTNQPLLVRRATYIPGWSHAPRVLLVEDDPICRNLTTKFLQIFGCQIDVAADGVEAVQKMQQGVYDICMMDISMPNLDGELVFRLQMCNCRTRSRLADFMTRPSPFPCVRLISRCFCDFSHSSIRRNDTYHLDDRKLPPG